LSFVNVSMGGSLHLDNVNKITTIHSHQASESVTGRMCPMYAEQLIILTLLSQGCCKWTHRFRIIHVSCRAGTDIFPGDGSSACPRSSIMTFFEPHLSHLHRSACTDRSPITKFPSHPKDRSKAAVLPISPSNPFNGIQLSLAPRGEENLLRAHPDAHSLEAAFIITSATHHPHRVIRE
jgi:hypothetical protein